MKREVAAAPQPASQQAAAQPSSPLLHLFARRPNAVALACFFLSGATGLVYEVVWARRLTLIFGTTVLAVSTVLAAFLGGLAVGSIIFGRVADRRRDPFRMYAALEAGVGIICFLTPFLFQLVESVYLSVHPSLAGSLLLLRLARFVLCAVVLVVPTALMGGTLPALSRAIVRRPEQVGRHIAALYGTNTLGAVVGAAGAGFLLIPAIGMQSTVFLAAIVNLGIAVVALALHQAVTENPPPVEGTPQPAIPEASPAHGYRGLLVAYALCGAASLIYEVAWTRILSLAFGTTVYAFSAMLAAFLAGIGLGSLVLASPKRFPVDRLREPLVVFGVVQVGIAASVTFLTPVLDHMPFVFLALFRWVEGRFWELQFTELAACMLVMLPPAALMGFAFPLVTRIATESIGVLGRRLAAVYAANTLGTVVGSFLAGFVLIPFLGVRHALAVGVAINGAVGLYYLTLAGRRRRRLATFGVILAAVTAGSWFVLPDWNKRVLSSGAYVYPAFYMGQDAINAGFGLEAAREARARMEEKELLYYRDALTGTLSITRITLPGQTKPLLSLQINGKTDASTGDLSTQLVLAHLPALLHPNPRSALVVGLASGCTLGALTLHKEIQSIDCVEIEPDMARVCGFFSEVNHGCLHDPRVNLVLDDARNYMLVTKRKYDLITSEPSNPWISGVANLFTREHFVACRERLLPGGLVCQWLPIYNLAPDDLRCVVRTFSEVFPNASLWLFPDLASDAYLIGTLEPQTLDVANIAARMRDPRIAGDLAQAKVKDLWSFLAGYCVGSDMLAKVGQDARENTDNFPVIEFASPMRLHTGIAQETLRGVLEVSHESSPPLSHCDETLPNGAFRSALLDLQLARLPASEAMQVRRDPEAYMSPQRDQANRIAAHATLHVGSGVVEVYARRAGTLSGVGVPTEPAREPERVLSRGPHAAALWTGANLPDQAVWMVRWTCPANALTYTVVGSKGANGAPPSPEEVLGGLACCR